jgi:hypothetical protein
MSIRSSLLQAEHSSKASVLDTESLELSVERAILAAIDRVATHRTIVVGRGHRVAEPRRW